MWCEDTERGSADRIHKGLSDKVIRMSLPAQKAGNQILARRVSSGIAGLDTLLDGGFPEGKVVLVLGEPGTGKTIPARNAVSPNRKGDLERSAR